MTALDSIPLFQCLTAEEFQALQQIVSERRYHIGQDIFHEGSPGDGVYFVNEGLVEISSGAGNRRIFSQLGPGEIFGEMAVIDNQPRSATATATKETGVYFIPRSEMLEFIGRSPKLTVALLQLISRRLREFNQRHLREILEAERLSAVGSFARSIIHDLKNPLSIISLSVDLFASKEPTPESRAQLQSRVRHQVQRINDLAGDILAFTEGRRTAELKPGDFRAFVLKEAEELREEVAAKSIRLILEDAPPSGVAVLFDARRLGRVLHNLVQNAADFLAENGEIRLRFKSGEKKITVEVQDNGPGIAPEIAGNLFQPFATHGKAKGTGLGLSICKKIVEDHGGSISARSEAGRGATFSFTLPLAK